MYTIERDVPLPDNIQPRRTRAPRRSHYPFVDMRVGDSFFVENRVATSLHASLVQGERTLRCRFIARDVDGGCRVWRTE